MANETVAVALVNGLIGATVRVDGGAPGDHTGSSSPGRREDGGERERRCREYLESAPGYPWTAR